LNRLSEPPIGRRKSPKHFHQDSESLPSLDPQGVEFAGNHPAASTQQRLVTSAAGRQVGSSVRHAKFNHGGEPNRPLHHANGTWHIAPGGGRGPRLVCYNGLKKGTESCKYETLLHSGRRHARRIQAFRMWLR
jgi:hypothetical protein